MAKKQTANTVPSSSPIFIHSLWRSGSTYIFNAFRRSCTGYYCYQEPIHEIALSLKDNLEDLLLYDSNMMQKLRHPTLDKPYFKELYDAAQYWKDLISKPIFYDQYFETDCTQGLEDYINALLLGAKGRPVIQECRTTSRIGAIKSRFAGIHIYLWRNPWDQWWSYKSSNYFDVTTQLLINANPHPPIIDKLKAEIKFKDYHSDKLQEEFDFYDSFRLSAEDSYLSYYILWLLSMHSADISADLQINMDFLSEDLDYQSVIIKELLTRGIDGIDFTDCKLFRNHFSNNDKDFFSSIENRAHKLFLSSGYSQNTLDKILAKRFAMLSSLEAFGSEEILHIVKESTARAHDVVLRNETESAARLNKLITDHHQLSEISETFQITITTINQQLTEAETAREIIFNKCIEQEQDALARIDALQQEHENRQNILKEQIHELNQQIITAHLDLQELSSYSKQSEQSYLSIISDEKAKIERIQNEYICELREQHQSNIDLARRHQLEIDHLMQKHSEIEIELKEQIHELNQQIITAHLDLQELSSYSKQSEQSYLSIISDEKAKIERIQNEYICELREQHQSNIDLARQHQLEIDHLKQRQSELDQSYMQQLLRAQQQASNELRSNEHELRLGYEKMEANWKTQEESLRIKVSQLTSELQNMCHASDIQCQIHDFEAEKLELRISELKSENANMRIKYTQLASDYQDTHQSLQKLLKSVSWRIMAPFRLLSIFFAGDLKNTNLTELLVAKPDTEISIETLNRQIITEQNLFENTDNSKETFFLKPAPEEFNSILPAANYLSDNFKECKYKEINMDENITSSMNEAQDQLINLLLTAQSQFISASYALILGRKPDDTGMSHYTKCLESGMTRLRVLNDILNSQEANSRAIKLLKFRKLVKLQVITEIPFFGSIVRIFFNKNLVSQNLLILKAIEIKISRISKDIVVRLDQLEAQIDGLSHNSYLQVANPDSKGLNLTMKALESAESHLVTIVPDSSEMHDRLVAGTTMPTDNRLICSSINEDLLMRTRKVLGLL